MKAVSILVLTVLLSSCTQKSTDKSKSDHKVIEQTVKENILQSKNLKQIDEQIKKYIARDKFTEGNSPINPDYPGLNDETMRELLNGLLNAMAQDFQKIAHDNPSEEKYRFVIKLGLKGLKNVYMDSEDQDQICSSIEELMDIVGLKSSGGVLNKWRYGV